MTPPLEHDYIGIGMGIADSDTGSSSTVSFASDLKTDLRLGLPGSESPERRANGSEPSLTLSMSTAARGFGSGSKRGFSDAMFSTKPVNAGSDPETETEPIRKGEETKKKPDHAKPSSAKAQVVGWPPVRNYRRNTIANPAAKKKEEAETKQECVYVKVSMDGAPYLRKTNLKMYTKYEELRVALEKMFSCFTIGQCGSHAMPTRDGQTENKLTDHGSENVLTYEDKDGDWMLVGDVPWEMFTETCRRLRIMKASDAIGLAPRAAGKVKTQN